MTIKSLALAVLCFWGSGALGQSWIIGSDRIERKISFGPESGLVTERLTDLSTRKEFIPAAKLGQRPASEFSFVCNGETLSGAKFELIKADEDSQPDGKSLTIHLRKQVSSL